MRPLKQIEPPSSGLASGRSDAGLFSWLRRIVVGTMVVGMTGLSLAAIVWNPFVDENADSTISPRSRKGVTNSTTTTTVISAKSRLIEVLSTDSQTRRVRDVAGVCDVPLHPRRIVALAFADELIALGLKPHAMANGRSWALFEDYLGDSIKDVVMLPYGHFYDVLPCYDAIADCHPDLILVQGRDEHTYRQLCTIAPTLVLRAATQAPQGTREKKARIV